MARQRARRGLSASKDGAEGEHLEPRGPRQLVDEAFGEEAGVAVRGAAPIAGRQAEVGRRMIDRDGGDVVGRHRPGHRRPVRPDQPAARAEPRRHLGAGRRRRDQCVPALQPPLLQPAGHLRRRRGPEGVALDLLDSRPGQLHRPAHLQRQDRRLLDRVRLQLAAVAAAGEHRIERHPALGEADRPGGGGAGEARAPGSAPRSRSGRR